MSRVTSVVIAGLGGQGVVRASDILAHAAFRSGCDVKKGEVRGMSQRGGSVTSDVRFGGEVLSPIAPPGEADFLIVLAEEQVEIMLPLLREGGKLIHPGLVDEQALPHPRSLNVALLGVLSAWLDIAREHWLAAIQAHLPERVHEVNVRAFEQGRLVVG